MCLEWMKRSGDSAGSMASFPYVPRKAGTVLASVINLTGSTVTEKCAPGLAYTDTQIRLIRTGKAHPNVGSTSIMPLRLLTGYSAASSLMLLLSRLSHRDEPHL